jgi:putative endonuclease
MKSKEVGALGEKIALRYLKNKGYQVLDKNYSIKFFSGLQRGEIDIIAKKENVISFIEVKTLTGENLVFSPERKVNFLKQRKLIKTAKKWLMEKKLPLETQWQIDVIAIRLDPAKKIAKIRHFKNAVF